MNEDLKVGQILWLKVRYQIDKVSDVNHPMLIAEINDEYIEVIAIDKTAGKLQNLYYPYNRYINSNNPHETVLYEDSYAQLNTKLTIENFTELKKYRKTMDLLSKAKLKDLLDDYKDYQSSNKIKEERIVHMTKNEILELNEI
jgi:patatin-like phospholipase/acyl hydrolase